MSKTMNPNKPFVGRMKDQKTSYISGRSLRAVLRHSFNTHKTMIRQFIPEFKHVGGSVRMRRTIGSRAFKPIVVGGRNIITGGKTIWHDAAAFDKVQVAPAI